MKGAVSFRYVAILIVMFFSLGRARGNDIRWLNKEIDMGVIEEDKGPSEVDFSFINEGEIPTYILNVRTTCGCTAAAYTKEFIQPGDTGRISVTYDPTGRPGSFEKTIRVAMGETGDITQLKIKGRTAASDVTVRQRYPVGTGSLRSDSEFFSAGEMKKGGRRHMFGYLYNTGPDTLKVDIKSDAKPLEVTITPAEIAPAGDATIGMYLDTGKEKNLGPVEYSVGLWPRKEGEEPLEFKIKADILPAPEDFTLQQYDRGGRIVTAPRFVEMGEDVGDETRQFEFKIFNEGESVLEIYRVYSESPAIDIERLPKKIKPGKNGTVKGLLNATRLPDGPFRLKINVISDDALHSLQSIDVVGIKDPD